jgi:GT2 family glycosyltransferase
MSESVQGLAESVVSCERLVTTYPRSANAWYNLGLAKKRLHRYLDAASAFATVSRIDSKDRDALQQAVSCVALDANGTGAGNEPEVTLAQSLPHLSVIVCSVSDEKADRIRGVYEQLIPSAHLQLTVIRDAHGLSEAYNRGIATATGEIVIFSHDDIEIHSPDFAARVAAHLRQHELIGVAGTTRFHGPAWMWSGSEFAHSWVAHRERGVGEYHASVAALPINGGTVNGIQAMDGVWLAARREVLQRLTFDEAVRGFHFYDLDFTYRAFKAGVSTAIVSDLCIVHHSRGSFGDAWQVQALGFLARHPELQAPSKPACLFEAVVNSPMALRRFSRSWCLL